MPRYESVYAPTNSKKRQAILLYIHLSVLHKLSRGYAALRVRLRPTNSKKDRQNYSEFIFHTTKTGGGRGFAVSRKRESYGKNLPEGQIDERRHLMVFGKSM